MIGFKCWSEFNAICKNTCWQLKCANPNAGCCEVIILGSPSVEPLGFGKQRTLKKIKLRKIYDIWFSWMMQIKHITEITIKRNC
jgi:hypothetical protein